MHVPFVDLKIQYQSLKPEIDAVVADILTQATFVGGTQVKDFENDFAKYMRADYCVACGNGTDALEIALQALGIGAGDEVIVPAMSWISTSEAVTTVGAQPIFADILPERLTIDPEDIENKISKRTKAIIPVHLYGRAAEMDQIMNLATKYNLKVIEDAAQAHGTAFAGKRVGTFGDLAAFSFYPGKNLGAYGDAGGILTNDEDLAETSRLIADHGQKTKHHHMREGRNSRMDTLQAAVLSVKLRHLESWTNMRMEKAAYYNERLQGLPIAMPLIESQHRHVFHLYVIQLEHRDRVMQLLSDKGIDTQLHYPLSLPELKPYSDQFRADDYPMAKKLGKSGLSLPMYAELSTAQQDYVIEKLKEILE